MTIEIVKTHIQKRIQQLPVHLANQIAAGEVVERPASVLKELLENSLDANSTEIEITIEGGGIGLIQVQDNGAGICKEDLLLAIASHATSKIASLSDLEGVESYGFRGEALASISSVSRLELISSVEDQECGWLLRLEGRDTAPSLQPIAKRPGTLIKVRDLFYNTPARRKFLKSEKTEMSYLEEVFKRVALSQPAVAFKFQQNEGLQKRLPSCKSLEAHTRRVAQLCGKRFIEEAYYIEAEANGLKLTGWLGSEKALRSQADLQYFYVNGRIVRDKVVMHAVRQAYQSMNLLGRYPAYVLYFVCDPKAVDVNVHPTKHEVRFREARTVHAFLSYAVQDSLNQGKSAISNRTTVAKSPYKPNFSFLDKHYEVRDYKASFVDNVLVSPETFAVSAVPTAFTAIDKQISLFGGEFLLIENNAELIVLDVKAARRVYLQNTLSAAYHREGITKRPLLMPKSLMLPKGSDSIEASPIDWARLGFELTMGGHHLILIRSVPQVFGPEIANLSTFFLKLLPVTAVEQAIQLLVDDVVQSQNLSANDVQQLLINLKNAGFFKETTNSPFYRQITLDQFRSIFYKFF